MGKREVRVIVVPKRVTLVLLVLVSLLMAALVYSLSGKAYSTEEEPVIGLMKHVMRRETPNRSAVLTDLMPAVANVLLFVPWGFLAFLLIDSPKRARSTTYVDTVVLGAFFALVLSLWQQFLPTRVTGPADAFANVAGALVGALAGDLRKRVRFRFDH